MPSYSKISIKETWSQDLLSGIVVFLVALPLCLGIALASGAPLFSGVIAGIAGGIIIGLVSGSPLSVSGPAAGLSTIVLASIQELGDFRIFLLAVVLAGLIQVLFGQLKFGKIADFIPSAVIRGMLAAIGLILILKQIPHAVGYDGDFEGDESFTQSDGRNTFSEIIYSIASSVTPGAILICIFSIAILLLWDQPVIKQNKYLKLIPAPLLVVTLGITATGFFASFFPSMQLQQEHLVNLPVAEGLSSFIQQFNLPDFTAIGSEKVWKVAITLAVVASIESLLSLEAVDKLDPYKRISPTNRELVAQGAGNIISGMTGGLPVTSVIVRSSANVYSGAVNKTSAIAHGIYLLVAVILLPGLLNRIPLASLASILILTGYKLAHPSIFKNKWIKGRAHFIPFVVTIASILLSNLLTGIILGLLCGAYFILISNYRSAFTVTRDGSNYYIQFNKDLSFINKSTLKQTFSGIEDGSFVIIDLRESRFIDLDNDEIIQDFVESAPFRNIDVEMRKVSKT